MIRNDDPQIAMAAERTLLAWVRTGIAVMALGFAVARAEAPKVDAALIGAALILLGAIANGLAAREYSRLLPSAPLDRTPLKAQAHLLSRPRPYSVPLARILGALGIALAVWLLIRTAREATEASTPVRLPHSPQNPTSLNHRCAGTRQ